MAPLRLPGRSWFGGSRGHTGAAGFGTADGNSYASTNLVASSAKYDPQIVDPDMVDAWGLANRPAGAGGHIWVAANKTGNSLEYVGDVGGTPLNQQDLRVVSVPGAPDSNQGAPTNASTLGQPTGIYSTLFSDKYIVDQRAIKAPAKFIFAGQDGTISAWTEQATLTVRPLNLLGLPALSIIRLPNRSSSVSPLHLMAQNFWLPTSARVPA